MKKFLALVALSLIFAPGVSAHEGSVDLTSGSVSCKGVSIYQDGYYRVSGRCDGLVYPYETTYNKYVLWGKTSSGSEMVRIAEVDKGYFSGNISGAFDNMYISAEQNSLVRKMSDKVVVSGKINLFDFDKSKVTTVAATTTTAATTTKSGTTSTTTAATTTTSTAGAVVGKIVTSLLVVILIIVGLAIGASLIFRSRGSVSA